MFGFGGKNKEYNVRLTEKEMRNITKNMSKLERKSFEKRQERTRSEMETDLLMFMEAFIDV